MGCRCGSIHILSTEKGRENSDRGAELRTELSLITPHLNTGHGVVVETIDRFTFGPRIRLLAYLWSAFFFVDHPTKRKLSL